MLERFINWQGKRNGINWWEGPKVPAHPSEYGGRPLTKEEREYLASLETELADPPRPLRATLPTKSGLYVVLAVFAAVGAWDMVDRGQPVPCLGFVALAWLASKWAVDAYPGKHGQ